MSNHSCFVAFVERIKPASWHEEQMPSMYRLAIFSSGLSGFAATAELSGPKCFVRYSVTTSTSLSSTPGANQSAHVDLSEPDAVDVASLIRMLRLDSKGNTPKPLVDLVLRK